MALEIGKGWLFSGGFAQFRARMERFLHLDPAWVSD
jgi:hypothetical protein